MGCPCSGKKHKRAVVQAENNPPLILPGGGDMIWVETVDGQTTSDFVVGQVTHLRYPFHKKPRRLVDSRDFEKMPQDEFIRVQQ